jgi:hypothetical protein
MERYLGAIGILLVSLFLGACDRQKQDCGATLEERRDNVIGMNELS